MKKILVVSSFPAPYRVAVFRGLAQYYQMDVFFEFDKDQNRNQDWFVKSRDFDVLCTEEAIAKFEACLKQIREYDLVLAYDYLNKNARKAMRVAMRNHVPYCVNCDGAFINRHIVKDLIKRYYVSHAEACFASGTFAREYFRYYGAEDARIYDHKFTSLVEADIFDLKDDLAEKENVKKELQLPAKKIVLTIGQFIHRKGFDVLLEAWESLDFMAHLVIIGGGDLKPDYMDYIAKKGYQNVTVLDFMKKDQLYRYYAAADLFVLPTREDIWGLVINEAMGCGLPVVSTNRCIAAVELVQDGENGYVVPVEDAQAFADAMKKILKDDDMCRRMRENNIRKMMGCTLNQIVQDHHEVIDTLL